MNNKCINLIKCSPDDYHGKKCYNLLQGFDAPCTFCTSPYISEDKFYEWEYHNKKIGKHFHIKNKKKITQTGMIGLNFTIQDSGIGIGKDFLSKIFASFEQEDNRSSSINKGIGLGLPISKHIINLMQGTLEITSNKGKGTTCIISLPIEVRSSISNLLNTELQENLAKLHVLVIDQTNKQNFLQVSEALGLKTDIASKIPDALIKLKEQNYDLCIVHEAMVKPELINKIPDSTKLALAIDPINNRPNLTMQYAINNFIHTPYLAISLLNLLHNLEFISKPTTHLADQDYNFCGKRILVVEDNELNLEIATELLTKKCNFTVESAENGKLAVDMFNKNDKNYYDLILMDICMPIMDGLEATNLIRSNTDKGGDKVPIVALSANFSLEDREKTHHCGMSAHLPKPLDMHELCPVFENILHQGIR